MARQVKSAKLETPTARIDILLTAQADEFGGLVSAIARVIITSSDGCTLASPGTAGGTSMLIFLLIPVLVLTRKLFRRKR